MSTTKLPDVVEAIKFRMAQYGHSLSKTSERTGICKSHLSEVLSRKRRLSINMIRVLHKYGIPAVVLIQKMPIRSKRV